MLFQIGDWVEVSLLTKRKYHPNGSSFLEVKETCFVGKVTGAKHIPKGKKGKKGTKPYFLRTGSCVVYYCVRRGFTNKETLVREKDLVAVPKEVAETLVFPYRWHPKKYKTDEPIGKQMELSL